MAANGISTLSTKQARQEAKMNAAQTKRQANSKYTDRDTYNLDLLPTKYNGNTVVQNSGPLAANRPWTSGSSSSGVALNGSTMMYYDGSLTGQADTTQMIVYFRMKRTGTMSTQFIWDYLGDGSGAGNIQHFHYGSSGGIFFTRLSDLNGDPVEGHFEPSPSAANDDTWRNYLVAFNSESGVQMSYLYIDDTLADSESLTLNEEVDFTTAPGGFDWGIFGRHRTGGNSGMWQGAVSHAYICTNSYLDITQEANRRKFFDADGVGTDLSGAPTPLIQFTGNAAAFNAGTNEGTGENFTVVGSFTDL